MPNAVITEALDRVASGEDLTAEETGAVLAEIMAGNASEAQIAAFLIALRTKGETVAELVGLARTMRALARPVDAGRDDLVDTAGTGGGRSTFNVSTTAALIAAGAGVRSPSTATARPPASPGRPTCSRRWAPGSTSRPSRSRAASARSASASCSPAHHQATRFVVPVRKELAVRTIFNFLGPLTNPAGATRQVIGVSDARYQDTIAGALRELGARRALVVSSDDGLDEMSTSGTTQVVELDGDRIERYTVSPQDVGLDLAPPESVAGGTPEENAATTRGIFAGQAGPARDLAVLNAGAAIYASGRVDSLAAGVVAAAEAVDGGAAADLLERFVARTQELAPTA